ncbi:DegV family protein [Anaerotardibacter muris]|uniref:DegV family protein n=1 Tax=Anaerotardibacter muris TaxID=2941505 RepID=UPI00203BFF1D|nr:DegV family protein [Anaerotardibacter muris]
MTTKCSLIIDSCCDLPREVVSVDDVYLLGFSYNNQSGSHKDDMYESLTAHDFFDAMREGDEPTTSQVSPGEFIEMFQTVYEKGMPAVLLSFSSALSGSYQAACMAAEQVKEEHPDFEIYVVDSKLASVAEGLLVYEAIRQQQNGMSAKELAEWAEEALYYVHGYFMVSDLESLHRGGRIPASVAIVGSKLDAKPLLGFGLDGSLALVGVARGRKKGMKALIDYFERNREEQAEGGTVLIGNADCPKDVQRLADLLDKTDEDAVVLECSIGPVIGCHVGPDMLAIVFWGKDRRETVSVVDRIANKVKRNRS